MPSMTITAVRRLAGVTCAAALLLSGCASKRTETAPSALGPASAAVAPAPIAPPVGDIRKLGGHPVAAVVDPGPAGVAVLGGSGPSAADTVTVLGRDRATIRTITLPAPAATLVADATRARMLGYLLGGELASAGELAACASVSATPYCANNWHNAATGARLPKSIAVPAQSRISARSGPRNGDCAAMGDSSEDAAGACTGVSMMCPRCNTIRCA